MKKRTLALAAVVAGLVGGCFEHPGLQKITPTTTQGGCSGTSANGLFAGGAGSQSDPFQICTPAQFLNLGNLTNDGLYFRLDSDLNFTGTPFVPVAIFSGNLDGQNHLISNVGAVSPYTTGIFPYLREGAVVRRLRIQNAVFLGGGAVGVIAGDGLLATVEDITATNVTVQGASFVGGLLGLCDRCTIARVSSQGPVTGTGSFVGGVIGGLRGTLVQAKAYGDVSGTVGYVGGVAGWVVEGTVSNCLSAGDVSSPVDRVGGVVGSISGTMLAQCGSIGDVSGRGAVGGVVGEQTAGTTVAQTFSRGTITGTGFIVGGIVALNSGDVIDSYHQGNVSSPGNSWVSGGIAYHDAGAHAVNLYAVGTVNGAANFGGVVGGSAGTIVHSFWNFTVYAFNNGLGTPLTNAQMQVAANYTGWDFTAVWEMGLVFPALQWE